MLDFAPFAVDYIAVDFVAIHLNQADLDVELPVADIAAVEHRLDLDTAAYVLGLLVVQAEHFVAELQLEVLDQVDSLAHRQVHMLGVGRELALAVVEHNIAGEDIDLVVDQAAVAEPVVVVASRLAP